MAEYLKVKCPACGSFRNLDAFGIDATGNYEPVEHPTVLSVNRIGSGRCTWDHQKLPKTLAVVIRQALVSALERVDALIGSEL